MVIIKSDQAMDQWETFGIDDLNAVSSTRNTLVLNKETSSLFGTPEKPFARVRTSWVSVSALIFCCMSEGCSVFTFMPFVQMSGVFSRYEESMVLDISAENSQNKRGKYKNPK